MTAWKGRRWSELSGRRPLEAGVEAGAGVGASALAGESASEPETEPTPRRILLVNQYYWPDRASTAQHLTDLAESLAAAGDEVHVLCGRGSSRPGEPKRRRWEQRHGVTIHRVGATSLGRTSTLHRMADYLSFYASAALKCWMLPRFEVVVTLTTPPLIALLGLLLKWRRGSKHVYWSMDLHPDASLALGRMRANRATVRLLRWLSETAYRHADRVVALGPYMADRIRAKGVPEDRIAVIPVWSRADEIGEASEASGPNPLRRSLGLEGRFVAMYSGNLGLAHTFEAFLEAARAGVSRSELVWLFVGGGPRRREVEAAIAGGELPNVRVIDSVPREDLSDLLSLADVHLISMRPEMVGIVVPSKLYGAMATGRPCVFVGPDHCEAADLVREAECGMAVRQDDPSALLAAIERLVDDRAEAARLGGNGRSAFLERFEREACCDEWRQLIAGLTVRGRATSLVGIGRPGYPARLAPGRVRLPGRRPLADAKPAS